MVMARLYTTVDDLDDASIRTIRGTDSGSHPHRYHRDLRRPFHGELIARPVKDRDKVVVATKSIRLPLGRGIGCNSSASNIRIGGGGVVAATGTDYIDLYYQHRVEYDAIKDTIGTLADLVAEGKVEHVGCPERPRQRCTGRTPSIPWPRCRRCSLWSRDRGPSAALLRRSASASCVWPLHSCSPSRSAALMTCGR